MSTDTVELADTPPLAPSILCGLPVDPTGQIELNRLNAVTEGRRKVPLRKLAEYDFGTPADVFIAAVVVGKKGDSALLVSDMIMTGSTEFVLAFEETEGVNYDKFLGKCMLVLNPRLAKYGRSELQIRVGSVKNCLQIGSLSGIATCEIPLCSKPVLTPRDGTMCYAHAGQTAGVRVSIGGEHGGTLIAGGLKIAPVKRKSAPLTSDEKAALDESRKRSEILAKKKTALALLNRRSSTGGNLRNTTLSDQIDIGETDPKGSEFVARFQELKRKREQIEKADLLKEKVIEKKKIEETLPVPEKTFIPPASRKSLLAAFDQVCRAERGSG
jgi:hypothetical protein